MLFSKDAIIGQNLNIFTTNLLLACDLLATNC